MDTHSYESHELYNTPTTPHATSLEDIERQQPFPNVVQIQPLKSAGRSTSFLDGLRGLAAVFVVIQHYVGTFDGNVHEHGFGQDGKYYYIASLPFIRVFFSGGSAAVAIFFVLSGFVLSRRPLRLLRDGDRDACGTGLLSAVIRRPIRLYLPCLGVTFAVAVLLHAPGRILREVSWPEPESSLFAEAANWVIESLRFLNPFRTHSSNQAWYPYSIVLWTIPIELKGSILIYSLSAIFAFNNLPRSWKLLSLISTSIPLLHLGQWTMTCFIFGLTLSVIDIYSLDTTFLANYLRPFHQSLLHLTLFITGYYLLCLPSHDNEPSYASNTPGYRTLSLLTPSVYDKTQYYRYWHSWGSVLVVFATLRLPWLQAFLNTGPLRYLGRVSFMLYLVHLPVIGVLGVRVARFFGQTFIGAEGSWWQDRLWLPDVGPTGLGLRVWASFGVLLPICLGIAELGTRLLDEPSVRLGKRLVRRLGLDGNSVRRCGGEPEEAPMIDGEERQDEMGR